MANPKTTFLTEERLEKAKKAFESDRSRREKERKHAREVEEAKPGKPFYQPSTRDNPEQELARARAQGRYMKEQVGGTKSKMDEGVLVPAERTLKNVIAGKRGKEATEGTVGDKELMEGAYKAGQKAVGDIYAREYAGEGAEENRKIYGMKKGGAVKKYAKGGSVSSASKRADGCAQRGKTKGRMV